MTDEFVAIAIEELRGDDDVAHSSFVFEGQEDKSFGRTRTLTNNYPTPNAREVAVTEPANINRAQGFQMIQFLPVISNRMLADSEAGTAKVSVNAFSDGHRLEGGVAVLFDPSL